MRISPVSTSAIGLGLLALAMTALAIGFSLFFMSPHEVAKSQQVWLLSSLPAMSLATTTALNKLLRKQSRT